MRQIVGLEFLARPAEEDRSLERVAAGLRHDVQHQPRGLRLTEAAGRRERDFLRVADVRHISGWLVAANGRTDVQPVDGETALVVAAAMDRELRCRRPRHRVVQVGDDAGHQQDHGVVTADAGDGLEHVVVQRELAPCVLNVDDRRLTSYRNRFCERADPQVDVNRRRK